LENIWVFEFFIIQQTGRNKLKITSSYNHQKYCQSIFRGVFVFLILTGFNHAAIIESGMILNIMVKGDDLLTQQVKVSEDGSIEYPLYQDVSIVGMTTSELQEVLTIKLVNYSDAAFVLVTVLTEMPITITVMGQIKKPGPVRVLPGSSLQEILLAGGGTTEYANLENIKIISEGQLDEDASYYNLQEFLTTGKISTLPVVKDKDKIIILARSKNNQVKILGAVNSPGYYTPQDSITLFDILYLAGGPSDNANLSKVRIMSTVDNRETDAMINLQKYIDKGKMKEIPLVLPGDVVIVYRKTFTWGKTLAIIRDVATLVTAMIIIANFDKIFIN